MGKDFQSEFRLATYFAVVNLASLALFSFLVLRYGILEGIAGFLGATISLLYLVYSRALDQENQETGDSDDTEENYLIVPVDGLSVEPGSRQHVEESQPGIDTETV